MFKLSAEDMKSMPKKDLVQQVLDTQNEIERLQALKRSIVGQRGGIE